MSIEANLFFAQENGESLLIKSDIIDPNDIRTLDYFNFPKVLVICDQDGNGGSVIIGSLKNVGVRFYENDDDEKGKLIDPRKPIRLEKGQEIVIWSKDTRRELNIFVEAGDENDFEIMPPTVSTNF